MNAEMNSCRREDSGIRVPLRVADSGEKAAIVGRVAVDAGRTEP